MLIQVIEFIIYNNIWKLNKKKWTPLHRAIFTKSKEMAELLISKGAYINAKDIIANKDRAIILKLEFYTTS